MVVLRQKLKSIGTTVNNCQVCELFVIFCAYSGICTRRKVRIGIRGLLRARVDVLARVEDRYLAPPWVKVNRLVVRCLDSQAI